MGSMENQGEQEVVYLTDYSAADKPRLGRYTADTHNEWRGWLPQRLASRLPRALVSIG